MKEIETKELVAVKAQISRFENLANSTIIESQEDYGKAVDIVSKLKELGSEVKSKKESVTKPLNEALRSARSLFAPIEEQIEKAESIVKGKILAYKQKVDAEARAKEAKIASQVESGHIKLETAERKVDAIERVESTTRGKVGEVQIRKVKKVRIINEAELPRNYLIPDMVAIRRDALGGIAIAGVEVYEEETVAAGSY